MQLKSQPLAFLKGGEFLRMFRELTDFALAASGLLGAATQCRGQRPGQDGRYQEDQRIDYGPVTVGDKTLVLPVRKMLNTEVVPTGESGSAGKYTTRRTLLTSEYKDFQLSGSK